MVLLFKSFFTIERCQSVFINDLGRGHRSVGYLVSLATLQTLDVSALGKLADLV